MSSSDGVVQRSENEQKYDRQTRIWGAHGQHAIETAHVCILGASATGSEVLKNLVLPNVGEFTLVDDAVCGLLDRGTNFFTNPGDEGKPLAEVVAANIVEMNPDVTSHAVVRSPAAVVDEELGFLDKFTVVVATQMDQERLLKLSRYLYEKGIPLVAVKTYGLLGFLRLSVPRLLITESHYENDRTDLHLSAAQLEAWPELKEFCFSFDLNVEDTRDHSHTPYPAILAQLLAKWRAEHGGEDPKSYSEKKEFKQMIIDQAQEYSFEENYQEAARFAHKAIKAPELDDSVQAVLAHEATANLTAESPDFFFMARAVKDFMDAEGQGFAPVSPELPDITALTEYYVRLRSIFNARVAWELDVIYGKLSKLLADAGRPADSISRADLAHFLRNFQGIAVVDIRPLHAEYDAATFDNEDVNEAFQSHFWESKYASEDDDTRPADAHWYFAWRAAEQFRAEHGRYPGDTDATVEADTAALAAIAERFVADYKLTTDFPDDAEPTGAIDERCLAEIVRQGAAEIHNTAAVMGGIAAQVALKVILQQFLPVNNTLVHNGIFCVQKSLAL